MEYWIVFDSETGSVLYRGSGSSGTAALQSIPEEARLLLVPQQVVAGREIDTALLKMHLARTVDVQAEQRRLLFLTPGSGQSLTYARKEAEARAWMDDATAATPFISAEANARGMTVADLAGEIIAQADAWIPIGSAIEGLRMGAKDRLATATALNQIVTAATVNWSAIDALANA